MITPKNIIPGVLWVSVAAHTALLVPSILEVRSRTDDTTVYLEVVSMPSQSDPTALEGGQGNKTAALSRRSLPEKNYTKSNPSADRSLPYYGRISPSQYKAVASAEYVFANVLQGSADKEEFQQYLHRLRQRVTDCARRQFERARCSQAAVQAVFILDHYGNLRAVEVKALNERTYGPALKALFDGLSDVSPYEAFPRSINAKRLSFVISVYADAR